MRTRQRMNSYVQGKELKGINLMVMSLAFLDI